MHREPNQDERNAEAAIQEIFDRFWNRPAPDGHGILLWRTAAKLARTRGLRGPDAAQELFDRFVQEALQSLSKRNPASILKPGPWFFQVLRNSSTHQVEEEIQWKKGELAEIARGETRLPEEIPGGTLVEVRAWIRKLQPRHQKFLELELLQRLSSDEICRHLKIQPNSCRTLRCEALRELRQALEAAIRETSVQK